MELSVDYLKNDDLRHKLNALTRKTFYFDFEPWVTGGYYEGDYIPYSLMDQGEIVSNVSVNRMEFLQNGVRRSYIQLGTVMTDVAYRHSGLARQLMERILREYEGKCDGIYLFGNLSALGFYRKLGFREGVQYRYRLIKRHFMHDDAFLPVKDDPRLLAQYRIAARQSLPCGAFAQLNGWALQMFYTANGDDVYYLPKPDCFVVLSDEKTSLTLKNVVASRQIPLQELLPYLPGCEKEFFLGFTPCEEDTKLFTAEIFDGGDDYRLMYMGDTLSSIEREKLFFPLLSHA